LRPVVQWLNSELICYMIKTCSLQGSAAGQGKWFGDPVRGRTSPQFVPSQGNNLFGK